MRSPIAIALLFTVLLVGWVFSRPIQELLAGSQPAATPEESAAPAARPGMTVRVIESAARPVAPELVINGRTEPARAVQLKAETMGRVIETPAAEGSMVEAGDVIARLDPRDRESRVREWRAILAQRELEYEAARKLGAKQFQAETRVAEALAALESARAALRGMEIDLEHVTIRAPFRGVLERRMVETGDYAEPGDPVAELIEQDPFLVVGHAPETMVGRLAVGAPGTAMLADGRTISGRLRFVATRGEEATRPFRVELEVPNSGGRLPAGMSARIVVREPEVAAHRISAAALVLGDDGTIGVKSVGDDGRVRFHKALIAKSEIDAVWLAGLPERVRLITTGQGFVAEGELVGIEVVPADPDRDAPTVRAAEPT